jgi:gliding motility-associated lipoprotein GldD
LKSKNILRLIGKFLFLPVSLVLFSCDPDPEDEIIVPKPTAYYRIDLPEKKYVKYDSLCPYSFETPVYSVIRPDARDNSEPCWINVFYPQFKATVHVSYKVINNNLEDYLKDSDMFAKKHTIKANGLNEDLVINDSAKVYGIVYDIKGNTATNLQFFLTDSTRNFLRGSLYFDVAPNIDSVEPVIKFLRKDVMHLIKTFRWKETNIQLNESEKIKKVK